jgi:hypothetical protein
MTPTWAVILVGIGGALLGSLVGTLLTISHERAAEFRAHQLNAADDFSTSAIAALQEARITAGEIKKDDASLNDTTGWFRKEIRASLDAANIAVDAAIAKRARIGLLFGDPSPVAQAATGVTSQLRNIMSALDSRPDSIRDREAMAAYSRGFDGTIEQHEKFNRAALVALNQTWWQRFQERRRLWKEAQTRSE